MIQQTPLRRNPAAAVLIDVDVILNLALNSNSQQKCIAKKHNTRRFISLYADASSLQALVL